jgi:hypothetical protein
MDPGMKTGTHNLGDNVFANITLAKVEPGKLVLRQSSAGSAKEVILSASQIELLKELLA